MPSTQSLLCQQCFSVLQNDGAHAFVPCRCGVGRALGELASTPYFLPAHQGAEVRLVCGSGAMITDFRMLGPMPTCRCECTTRSPYAFPYECRSRVKHIYHVSLLRARASQAIITARWSHSSEIDRRTCLEAARATSLAGVNAPSLHVLWQ